MVARRVRVELKIGKRDGVPDVVSFLDGLGGAIGGAEAGAFIGIILRGRLNKGNRDGPRSTWCVTTCVRFKSSGDTIDAGTASGKCGISCAGLAGLITDSVIGRVSGDKWMSCIGFSFFLMMSGGVCGIIVERESRETSFVVDLVCRWLTNAGSQGVDGSGLIAAAGREIEVVRASSFTTGSRVSSWLRSVLMVEVISGDSRESLHRR